jgi:uncharacterized membrane protein
MCFSYFTSMDHENGLKELQDELLALQTVHREQHRKIYELQQRLASIRANTVAPEEKPVSVKTLNNWNLENFIGLRLIHIVGIVVLVIGLSIGVKYAIDQNLISPGLRIGLAYAAGAVLYILSVRLKSRYNLFSAILFSGAMASLYFTTFGAFVFYGFFSFFIAFALMAALTVFTVAQAISYNRQEIAILGLVGAYAIPFLISVNAERIDLFFLYIALINTGLSFLVFSKEWKLAGRIAQAFTWIIVLGWLAIRFKPAMQWMGVAFITYFFLLFFALIVSRRMVKNEKLSANDVNQLVLNNLALYLSSLMVFGFSQDTANVAMITLFHSGLIAAEGILFWYFMKETITSKVLVTLSFALFIFFIGLEWDGLTVTMLWLLVASIVFALGYRLSSVATRMTAITLMGITLAKLLLLDSQTFSAVQKIISYIVLGILLLVVSFFYQKFKEKIFKD